MTFARSPNLSNKWTRILRQYPRNSEMVKKDAKQLQNRRNMLPAENLTRRRIVRGSRASPIITRPTFLIMTRRKRLSKYATPVGLNKFDIMEMTSNCHANLPRVLPSWGARRFTREFCVLSHSSVLTCLIFLSFIRQDKSIFLYCHNGSDIPVILTTDSKYSVLC